MTYKLNPNLAKIESPVILIIDGIEHRCENGEAVTKLTFERNYLVDKITARDNLVVITLKLNGNINTVYWDSEEAVSLF